MWAYFTSHSTTRTHSPLASSSQISKKAMRSYLEWQGPAVERFRVLSLVAGTEGRTCDV